MAPISVNIGGTYREMESGAVNIDGTWREIESMYTNIDGVWKESFNMASVIDNYIYYENSSTISPYTFPNINMNNYSEVIIYGTVFMYASGSGYFQLNGNSVKSYFNGTTAVRYDLAPLIFLLRKNGSTVDVYEIDPTTKAETFKININSLTITPSQTQYPSCRIFVFKNK